MATTRRPGPDREKRELDRAERRDAWVEDRGRTRLETPLARRDSWRPKWLREDSDAFGVFAEQFARFMGTASFLVGMTVFVAIWIGWNVIAPPSLRYDEYPFIFLTLMLSLQASYAAPLILLAQNRQERRDKVIAERDRQANTRAHADMEFLTREVASLRMSVSEMATRDFLRSELRQLLSDLDERADERAQQDDDEDDRVS